MDSEIAQAGARILLYPRAGLCYLAYEKRVYSFHSLSDASPLMCLLPLRVVDEAHANATVLAASMVSVVGVDSSGAILRLHGGASERDIKLDPALVSEISVDYLHGTHEDGWIETSAVFDVFNGTELRLDLFLPEHEQGIGKTVTIRQGEEVQQFVIARGRSTTVGPIKLESYHCRLEIAVDSPEPTAGSSEVRELGVLISGITVDGRRITAFNLRLPFLDSFAPK
jgi:hypothetical protein